MTTQVLISTSLIATGALILLVSLLKSRELTKSVDLVPARNQPKIRRLLNVNRGLMIFFLLGYLAVGYAYIFELIMISELFVAVVFLAGSVFVLIGLITETYLLEQIQTTLHGMLPICSVCKKNRTDDEHPDDAVSWSSIEEYISQRSDVAFTHGYCPDCYKVAIKAVDES